MTLEHHSENESPRPSLRFMSRQEVLDVFGFTKSTLFRRIKDGLLPPPVNFGGNFSRWVSTEIEAVFNAMVAGDSSGDVRALVADMIEQRKTRKLAA